MFHLLLCVTEIVKQLKLWEADDSNQICEPGQVNLTHTYWELCHPHDFSAFFPVYGFGSFPLDYRVWPLCSRMAQPSWKDSEEDEWSFHSTIQSGT